MDYSAYTDEELVELMHQGKQDVYEVLLEKYKYLVRAKKRTYFMSGSGEEDIIQEGMIGLFKAIRDYSPDKNCSFKSFAELCIKRQIISAVKSSTRQKHLPMTNYVSLDKPAYDDGNDKPMLESLWLEEQNDPQNMIIENENKESLNKKINDNLSSLEKTVLEMYMAGMSYEEMGEQLGKSHKSIDNALQRVKKKLTGSMDDN